MGKSNPKPPPATPSSTATGFWPDVQPANPNPIAYSGGGGAPPPIQTAADYLRDIIQICQLGGPNPIYPQIRAIATQLLNLAPHPQNSHGSPTCCDDAWTWLRAAWCQLLTPGDEGKALTSIVAAGIEHSMCGRSTPGPGDSDVATDRRRPDEPEHGGRPCGGCGCGCGCKPPCPPPVDPCEAPRWPDARPTGDVRSARAYLEKIETMVLVQLGRGVDSARRAVLEAILVSAALDRANVAHDGLRTRVLADGRAARSGGLAAAAAEVRTAWSTLLTPHPALDELRTAQRALKHTP